MRQSKFTEVLLCFCVAGIRSKRVFAYFRVFTGSRDVLYPVRDSI